MHAVMRYQIRQNDLELHLELLHAVYAELSELRPEGLVWATYQLEDPADFLEVMSGPELPEPLPALPAFQRYRSGLEARCAEAPTFTEVHPVGSYSSPGDLDELAG